MFFLPFVRNRFQGNTRKGEDGQAFIVIYCIEKRKKFYIESFEKSKIDVDDWSKCTLNKQVYGKGKRNIQMEEIPATMFKPPRNKKQKNEETIQSKSKSKSKSNSKSKSKSKSESPKKRKSSEGNNNSKRLKKNEQPKQEKERNLKYDTKY